MQTKTGLTLAFNVLAVIVMIAVSLGYNDFQVADIAKEIGAVVIAIINIYLRVRPLPREQENFR